MARFKKAAKKIINTTRFSWNTDILHTVTAMTGGGTMNIADIQAKSKAASENSLTDEQVTARCVTLNGSITHSVFNYLRRGLFDKEKLTVATQLVFKIMVQKGEIEASEVDCFLLARLHPDPHSRGTTLSEWMSEETWAQCRSLEGKISHGLTAFAVFNKLCLNFLSFLFQRSIRKYLKILVMNCKQILIGESGLNWKNQKWKRCPVHLLKSRVFIVC